MKKVFGIISWFPDEPTHRKQRLERLNKTFKHLTDLFGEEIEFLIIAQNWKDYETPEFIRHVTVHRFDKLGILGARKMLRTKFLESDYDYLIMCDDDIVLEAKTENAAQKYFEEIEKHPKGFSFIQYGWALTFCAISKWIYSQVDMVDIDPEKNEGYEDTTFPNLLHYMFKDKEFKTNHIFRFLQHRQEYKVNHKSTWMVNGINYGDLQRKTSIYIEHFSHGDFDIPKIKREIEIEWSKHHKNPETTYVGRKDTYLYF